MDIVSLHVALALILDAVLWALVTSVPRQYMALTFSIVALVDVYTFPKTLADNLYCWDIIKTLYFVSCYTFRFMEN